MKLRNITSALFILAMPSFAFSQVVDCSKFCVRDIQINPEDSKEMLVTIYYGDEKNDFISYTYLHEVLDSEGAQIAGPGRFFEYYGQAYFSNQTYTLPTELTAIPANLSGTVVFGYTDLFNEVSQDQVCRIPFPCNENVSIIRDITLFPNPARESFQITFDNPFNEVHTLSFFDFDGKFVFKTRELKRDFYWTKRDHLPNGKYVVQLKKGSEIIWTGKLILE